MSLNQLIDTSLLRYPLPPPSGRSPSSKQRRKHARGERGVVLCGWTIHSKALKKCTPQQEVLATGRNRYRRKAMMKVEPLRCRVTVVLLQCRCVYAAGGWGAMML